MTQNFYYNFLEYLSSKEKSVLLGHIQKHKVKINGFRTIKDVTPKLLALYFSQNEKELFEILKECYNPEYTNEKEAINNFLPDSAVKCFTYLIQVGKADEAKLTLLMQKKCIEEPIKAIDVNDEKDKRKSDEFRKKYLTTYKELKQTKERLAGLNDENQRLHIELESKEHRIALLEKDIKEWQEMVFAMEQKIDELEKECSRLSHIAYIQSRKVLVLSNSIQLSLDGVTVLSYDQIAELNQIFHEYSEILYVPSDMPFSSRRFIQKLDQIQEKLHQFYTYTELMDYLKNGRK